MGIQHNDLYDGPTAAEVSESVSASHNRPVPVLTIVAHPIPVRIGDRLVLWMSGGRKVKAVSRNDPDFTTPGSQLGKPLADPFLSRKPFSFSATPDGGVTLNMGNCSTPIQVQGKPVSKSLHIAKEQIAGGVSIQLRDRILLLLHLGEPLCETGPDHGLVGASEAMDYVRREIQRVADLKVPILLRGPSGSGKELVAQAIHRAGGAARPFVAVNMGAVPPSLAAGELFGSQKGAYTGADRHQAGYFRTAHTGTLFLDEIGEAPAEIQVLLLRALETGEVQPLGAQKPIPVDVRLIAATDAHLEHLIEADSFKAPLLHRLAGYEIQLPPLVHRKEDIGRLFLHFARGELTNLNQVHRLYPDDPFITPWLPVDLAEKLLHYSWPGNVRELRNMVRQLLVGCRDRETLTAVPKVANMLAAVPVVAVAEPTSSLQPAKRRKPADITPAELVATLVDQAWDLKATAEALHISRAALYILIEKHPELRKPDEVTDAEIIAARNLHGPDLAAMSAALQMSRRALARRLNQLA